MNQGGFGQMPNVGAPPPTGNVTTSSQAAHNHGIGSEDRAVVVGKSMTKASGANQIIDVLVDIAG